MSDIKEVFLYLIGCALHGETPSEELLADVDWAQLYTLAKKHSLVSVIGHAIENTAAFQQATPELRKAWREAKEKAVRKTLMLDTERAALFAEFEKQGIWYMPLKGILMKDYYPHFGMREMSDNDILFDPEKRTEVRDIFANRGYSVKGFSHSNHDTYKKPPVLSFEMHVMLFAPYNYPELAAYYDHVQDMLIKDEGNAYGYHFSDEDFYVFMIAHAYKHFSNAGTGLRTLADHYLLNQRLGSKLDRSVVDRALSTMGVLEYEQASRALADHIFDHPVLLSDCDLSESEQKMLTCYLETTTYGTMDQRVKNGLNKTSSSTGRITFSAKVRYFLKRLFPGRSSCKMRYPTVYRYPVLLPFFWVWRILTKTRKRLPAIKKECKALKEIR